MKTRILATFAIASVLAIGLSAPAFAAQSYTGALSANSAAPGGSVQYTSDDTGQPDGTPGIYSLSGGQGKALGAPAVQLASSVTHTVQVGAHSHLTFKVNIPASATPGSTYTLKVKAGQFADTQTIKVVGVAGSAAAASLAPLWIVITLALLIILALIVIVVTRRRRNKVA